MELTQENILTTIGSVEMYWMTLEYLQKSSNDLWKRRDLVCVGGSNDWKLVLA